MAKRVVTCASEGLARQEAHKWIARGYKAKVKGNKLYLRSSKEREEVENALAEALNLAEEMGIAV